MAMCGCLEDRSEQHASGMIKIGVVARHFNISVDLLRLYEREGLVIPLKSAGGTRYFTQHDFPWIQTVLRLVREARLNFAGIRHLLALLPCWELRQCGYSAKGHCPVIHDCTSPCWTNQKHCTSPQECYFCPVYRAAPSCENLKALLVTSETRMRPPLEGVHVV
jgi:MerR family transcriptional regulator, heat shock protein HspR